MNSLNSTRVFNYIIITFLFFIFISPNIFPQDINPREIKNKIFLNLSSGIHWEDRFVVKPVVFVGAGYYFTNGFGIKIGYIPVIVKVRHNNFPGYRYRGSELFKGDQIIINHYYLLSEFKIISNFWFELGFAPEEIFAVKLGLKYNLALNPSYSIQAEAGWLLVGTPTTAVNEFFRSNILQVGVYYMIN